MTTIPVNWTNITNFAQVITAVNTPNEFFWTAMYFMIFVIMLSSLVIYFGLEAGLLVSCFIGILIGLLLVYMGAMNVVWLSIVVGLFVLVVFIMYKKQGE